MATLPGGQEISLHSLSEEEQGTISQDLQGIQDGLGENGTIVTHSPGGTQRSAANEDDDYADQLDNINDSITGDDGNAHLAILNVQDDPETPTSTFLGDNLTGVMLQNQQGDDGTAQLNLMGNTQDNLIQASLGDDTLSGGDGEDTVYGGGGDDAAFDTSGASSISGGTGEDLLFSGDSNDTLSGGADDDLIFSGAGNDSVLGGAGNDSISGGEGQDSIYGGTGDDSLSGGDDDDIFFFEGGFGNDTIQDFSTGDQIDLSSIGVDLDSLHDNVSIVDGNAVITFEDGSTLTIWGEDSIDDDWFVV